jgi:hypothetical protein
MMSEQDFQQQVMGKLEKPMGELDPRIIRDIWVTQVCASDVKITRD